MMTATDNATLQIEKKGESFSVTVEGGRTHFTLSLKELDHLRALLAVCDNYGPETLETLISLVQTYAHTCKAEAGDYCPCT